MRLLWGVCIWLILASSSSMVAVYRECPNLSEETISALKKLKVTEDVHDKLVGGFREVWGPREVVDLDQNASIMFLRRKSDDNTLLQTMTADGAWFGGKMSIDLTMEKVDNGVYLARKDGVVKSVFFILYARNNVVTHYAWEACSRDLNAPPSNSKKRYINFVTGVSVQYQNLTTYDLYPESQDAVNEAVREIQGHEDLLGDIAELNHPPLLSSAVVHAPPVSLWAHIFCLTVLTCLY